MFGNKFTSGLFCALLLAGTVSGLILPDKTYSALEKRKLAQKPFFSAKNLFSGGFGSDLESYLADQFPARDSWVTAKTFAELASGKRESGGVYFAEDGYLFDRLFSYKAKQFKSNVAALNGLSRKIRYPDEGHACADGGADPFGQAAAVCAESRSKEVSRLRKRART